MNFKLLLLSVLLVTSLLIGGCGAPKEKVVEISYDDFRYEIAASRFLAVSPNDSFQIVLSANPKSDFKWPELADITDESIVKQTGHQVLPPEGGETLGKEVWTFEAIGKGSASITMKSQSNGGEQTDWTFMLLLDTQ
ncbi:MAG: protease inhibitor I42 family protein [Chloroflexota bacterium]